MKPDKFHEDPLPRFEKPKDYCKTCIYRYNELLGNPWPCNICMNFNEYIPEDELDDPGEFGSLENPVVCAKVIDLLDDLICRIDNLERLLPDFSVENYSENFVGYLKSIKHAITECYIFPATTEVDLGGPCYDGEGNRVRCDICSKDTCPYRR